MLQTLGTYSLMKTLFSSIIVYQCIVYLSVFIVYIKYYCVFFTQKSKLHRILVSAVVKNVIWH